MLEENTSPLYEADPHSLDELFLRLSKNQIKNLPRELQTTNFTQQVKNLRLKRLIFSQEYEKLLKEKSERKQNRGVSNSNAAIIERMKNTRLDF